jgi:3-hydroxybutyryl-CoA dehydrogenase
MSTSPIKTAGVVGAGVMGAGIAEVLAAAGIEVMIVDEAPGKAAAAVEQIASRQRARAAAGKISADSVEKLLARITPVETLGRLAGADLVVEAIIERLEPKRLLIEALEKIVGPDAIIATNTSSLSVTAIASAAERPQRVAGYHFFNPVPVMKLVEVISGAHTSPEVERALVDLAHRLATGPSSRPTPPASSSTTPGAPSARRPWRCCAKAWPRSARSMRSCATQPVSGWGRSS